MVTEMWRLFFKKCFNLNLLCNEINFLPKFMNLNAWDLNSQFVEDSIVIAWLIQINRLIKKKSYSLPRDSSLYE